MYIKFHFTLAFFIILNGQIYSQNLIEECNQILVQTIMEDIFNPPVASRIHFYANAAAYEVYCKKNLKFMPVSFFTSLASTPNPIGTIDYDIAAAEAFIYTGKKYIYTEDMMLNFISKKEMEWKTTTNPKILQNSIDYGRKVANHIISWSNSDNYNYTRTLFRYQLTDSLGAWQPTPPEYKDGLEPNWTLMRQLILPKDSFVAFRQHDYYSENKNSPCFHNHDSVYKKAKSLTQEEIDIAWYWDCNPTTTISNGHLMYVQKKPTPIGHWLRITGQVVTRKNIPFDISSQIYTTVCIAAYDAFINCWNAKYSLNTIRPETYIQRLWDPNYVPTIETPPFPEYPSGHSTVSAAVGTVLDNFFPNIGSFTDSSQIPLGMKARTFKSFIDAANEASISRFYGGIHILPALFEGQRMGKIIGNNTLRTMGRLKE